jgi:hypothetical protein
MLNDINTKFRCAIGKKQRDILIIIDEMHMAAAEFQTISMMFDTCKLSDPDFTYARAIRVVEFSATPDGVLRDRFNCKERSRVVIGQPGEGYTGCMDLLVRGSIKQSMDLSDPLNLNAYISHILTTFDEPRYHFIRTTEKQKAFIRDEIDDWKSVWPIEHDDYDKDTKMDINHKLEHKPVKHTFIFIKGMLRCAKTIIKTHIGSVYEYKSKVINDSTTIQGLLGRMTGYDTPRDIIVYTNIETIDKYKLLCESDFEDDVGWISNTKNKPTYGEESLFSPCTLSFIPIKVILYDDTFLTSFIKHRRDKVKCHEMLVQASNEGRIHLEDKNPPGTFNINTRTLKEIRHFRNGGTIENRRYKLFAASFDACKSTAQGATDSTTYAFDSVDDVYINGTFINPRNIAWITFRT